MIEWHLDAPEAALSTEGVGLGLTPLPSRFCPRCRPRPIETHPASFSSSVAYANLSTRACAFKSTPQSADDPPTHQPTLRSEEDVGRVWCEPAMILGDGVREFDGEPRYGGSRWGHGR